VTGTALGASSEVIALSIRRVRGQVDRGDDLTPLMASRWSDQSGGAAVYGG
jgi:hypothetical protein